MIKMKKKFNSLIFLTFNFLFINLINSESFEENLTKASFVQMSDVLHLRYNYNKNFIKEDSDSWDFDLRASYRFQQNFNQEKISAMIFSNSTIYASNQADRSEKNVNDIYGASLGLDENFRSKDQLKTRIRNHYLDLNLELGIPNSDFYLQVGLPFQGNYINNKVSENNVGDLTADSTNINSLRKYLSGSISTIGDMQKRKYCKLAANCENSQWYIAEIPVQIGWNGWQRDTSHLGFYLRGLIATGKKNCMNYTIAPVIGNNKSFELDFGLNSHFNLVEMKNGTTLRVDFDGFLGHVFKNKQTRTFDLNNGILSRYGLVKAFTGTEYQGLSRWAADITTQEVNINIPIKGEFILNSVFEKDNCEFNLGYSFKGQQKEKVSCNLKLPSDYSYAFAAQLNNSDLAAFVSGSPNNKVTPNSDMFTVSYLDQVIDPTSGLVTQIGSDANSKSLLKASDINVDSGLMNSQMTNILFAGYKHFFDCCDYQFTVGLNGSAGLSSKSSYSPEFWDFGITLESSF